MLFLALYLSLSFIATMTWLYSQESFANRDIKAIAVGLVIWPLALPIALLMGATLLNGGIYGLRGYKA